MAERRIGAQGAEEGLLEGVLRTLPPEPHDEHAEHLVAVFRVEELEGRDHGGFHHRGKRPRASIRENAAVPPTAESFAACSRCGVENPAGALFCNRCGAELAVRPR